MCALCVNENEYRYGIIQKTGESRDLTYDHWFTRQMDYNNKASQTCFFANIYGTVKYVYTGVKCKLKIHIIQKHKKSYVMTV